MSREEKTVVLADANGAQVVVTRREILRLLQDDAVTLFGLDVHALLTFHRVMNQRNMPLNRRTAEDILEEFGA